MAEQVAVSHDISKLIDKIKDVKLATLTTLSEENYLHGRPMYTCEPGNEGALWFFAEKDSQKIGEIKANSQVGLGYSDPSKATYVTVAGKASVTDDKDKIKELWREDFRGWFPKGSDDPNITLIKVEIEKGEFWDEPGNVFIRAYAYVKAVTTGEKHHPSPEEQSKVEA
ncbi:MAG: general stress protein [Hymenobacter sp.]|nr:MAG: general stress protein [Hymenobacter sp.]